MSDEGSKVEPVTFDEIFIHTAVFSGSLGAKDDLGICRITSFV